MKATQLTDGTEQPMTAAGPVAPTTGLAISAIPVGTEYMLEVEVTDLHAASAKPGARIVFEDTQNAFAAALPVCEFSFEGTITEDAPVKLTRRFDAAPGLRIGSPTAMLRVNLVRLDGTTPSITLRAALWT